MSSTIDTTMPSLTERQRRFVEAFVGEAAGNATKAARIAGYAGNDRTLSVTGTRLLANHRVRDFLEQVRAPRTESAVMTRERRQEMLSEFAEDARHETRDRIRAIEVLGRMQGDFVETREVTVTPIVRVVMPDNGRIPAPE